MGRAADGAERTRNRRWGYIWHHMGIRDRPRMPFRLSKVRKASIQVNESRAANLISLVCDLWGVWIHGSYWAGVNYECLHCTRL